MESHKTHYQVLGVAQDASESQIRTAYRRQAKLYHPDRQETGDLSRFQQLQRAYEVLCDPRLRRAYDHSLRRPAGRPARRDGSAGADPARAWSAPTGSGRRQGRPAQEPDTSLDAVMRALFGGASPGVRPTTRRQRTPFVDPSYSDEGTDAGRYAEPESVSFDVDYDIYLSVAEAASGVSATLATDHGPSVDVDIPPGVYNGEVLTASYSAGGRRKEIRLLVHVRR